MDAGVYVFSPTKEIFDDFANFVEVIEAVAGREQGIVKVIVPQVVAQQTRSDNSDPPQDCLNLLTSVKVSLGREKLKTDAIVAYCVETHPVVGVLATPFTVERHCMEIIDKWTGIDEQRNDVQRDNSKERILTEKAMIDIMLEKEENMLSIMSLDGA